MSERGGTDDLLAAIAERDGLILVADGARVHAAPFATVLVMVDKMLEGLRVEPGEKMRFRDRDPGDRLGLDGKAAAQGELEQLTQDMRLLQNRLFAEGERSVLLILQSVDAGGKDGTIRRVFSGVNPQGCRVGAFKEPTRTQLAYDFLWRIHAAVPRRGEIGIFNRSHYEDVVTVHVEGLIDDATRDRRFRNIVEFERILDDHGTKILKLYLHISQEEQRERLQRRIDNPEKRWKFAPSDLEARSRWDEYATSYERAIRATSTDFAPWYIIPANRKWARDIAVARLLVGTMRDMDPEVPEPQLDIEGTVVE